jgi:acyl-CoA hydrolase
MGELPRPGPVANPPPTRFLEMVFPEQSNHYGTLFGGTALSLMSKAAFVAASRQARRAVVMAGSHDVEFHAPVAVGQVVELAAEITRVSESSMSVVVEVVAETLLSGQRALAMRGRFEMVALDATGRPTRIETLPSSHPVKETAREAS